MDFEDDSSVTFRDVILLALAGFVFITVLLLPHLNPPGRQQDAEAKMPGNLSVEIRWPDELDTDVDLWVQAPGDIPVGYSNKGGLIFNLVRDDLGVWADPLGLNFENSYTRGVPPGEYTVNLHLFRNRSGTFPVPVKVAVKCRPDETTAARTIGVWPVELDREGRELTVARFRIDTQCNLEPGSVTNLQKNLRSAKR